MFPLLVFNASQCNALQSVLLKSIVVSKRTGNENVAGFAKELYIINRILAEQRNLFATFEQFEFLTIFR